MYLSRGTELFTGRACECGPHASRPPSGFLPRAPQAASSTSSSSSPTRGKTAADVKARYLLTNGTTFTRHYSVAAESRRTISSTGRFSVGGPSVRALADAAVSTTLESTNGVPILVERSMCGPAASIQWEEATQLFRDNDDRHEVGAGRKARSAGRVQTRRRAHRQTPQPVCRKAKVTLFFEDGASDTRTFDSACQQPHDRPDRQSSHCGGIRTHRSAVWCCGGEPGSHVGRTAAGPGGGTSHCN